MTRLNNTFRSSCKLLNRTTKQEEQAGQTYHLRSNSRLISSSNSSVFLDLHFIRTGRLFGTRLHERARRTEQLSRTLRVMDVARQSSMKEGLQVKLLSDKDISGDLIEGRVKGCASFTGEALLSVRRKDDGLNDDGENLQKEKESSDSNRPLEHPTTINGDIKIEAIVRADNRTQTNVKPVDKMLLDLESRSLTAISGKLTHENLTGNMPTLDTENGYVDQTVNPTQEESNSMTNCKLDGCGRVDDSHNGSTEEWTFEARPNTLVFICKKNGAHSSLDLHSSEKRSSRTQEDDHVRKQSEVKSDTLSLPLLNGDSVGLDSKSGVVDISKHVKVSCQSEKICGESNLNDGTEHSVGFRNVCDNFDRTGSNEQSAVGAVAVLEACKCESQSDKTDDRTQRRPKRNVRSLKLRNDDEYFIDIKLGKRKVREKDDIKKEGNKAKKPKIKKQKKAEKLKIKENGSVAERDLGPEKGSSEIHCDGASKEDNSEKYVNVECVLGMRQNKNRQPQILVQFTDGTSNWIGKSEMQSPISSLSDYFTFSSQDLAVLHRLPFRWFGEPLIEWAQRDLKVSDFGVIEAKEKTKLTCLSLEKREAELLERKTCELSSPEMQPVSENERARTENIAQEQVDNFDDEAVVDVERNGVIKGNIITGTEIEISKQTQNNKYQMEPQSQEGVSISRLHKQSDSIIDDCKLSSFNQTKVRTNCKLNTNWFETETDIVGSVGKTFGPPDLSYVDNVGRVKNATRDTVKPLDLSFVDMKINSLDLGAVKGHFGPPDLSYIDADSKLITPEYCQEQMSPCKLSNIEKEQKKLDKGPKKNLVLSKDRWLTGSKGSPSEETTRTHPTFISRNGELEVYEQDYIEIVLRHKDKRSKRIRSETCDNLIQQLESRIVDHKCPYIVISGLEEYFASTMDMDKLLKFPAEAEKTRYDEKMANLRYVFLSITCCNIAHYLVRFSSPLPSF